MSNETYLVSTPIAQVFTFLDLGVLFYQMRGLSDMLSGALDLVGPAVKP